MFTLAIFREMKTKPDIIHGAGLLSQNDVNWGDSTATVSVVLFVLALVTQLLILCHVAQVALRIMTFSITTNKLNTTLSIIAEF